MKQIISKLQLYHILLASLAFRIILFFFYADVTLVDEWANLVNNFESTGVIGFRVALDEFNAVPKSAITGERVLPSVFMPPLYFFFIYLIKIIFEDFLNYIILIIFAQILLSIVSILFFYKIIAYFENKNFSLLMTTFFGLFPIYVYSSVQISSISLQIFLLIFFLYFLQKLMQNFNFYYLIFFSIVSGLMILIRAEFLFFYPLTIFYLFIFFKPNLKAIVISLIITILTISPYLARNLQTFDKIIITKSLGYNLLKGNNPTFKVEGNAKFVADNYDKDIKIRTVNNYEIKLDDFYKSKAIEFIKNNPIEYFLFYLKKNLAFIFFDAKSSYPHYFNFFHIFPKIILSVFTLIGAYLLFKKKGFKQFLILYYFSNILLFSLFFILPRYSVILLPVQLIISVEAIKFLRRKFIN